MDFEILIKSFMRPESLKRLVLSIRKYYPNIKISVVDDSPVPVECPDCEIHRLPVDSGISVSRNFLLKLVKAPFFVLCDDDFVFVGATRLEELQRVMEIDDEIAIVGGRIIDMPGYKLRSGPARLSRDKQVVTILNLPESDDLVECDSTSNFFMGRTVFFRENNIEWDEKLKVEEHIIFFLNFPGRVVALSWVRVEHHPTEDDPEYLAYRERPMLKEVYGLEVVAPRMANILVTVPNLHWVSTSVSSRLLLLLKDSRYHVRISFPSNKPYENNQHHIIKDFLAGDWDYWLSIDADNPPEKNPLDLVVLNKDIIGLPTPIWHYTRDSGERPIYFNTYCKAPEGTAYNEYQPQRGLQKVDAIGTGCFLVARRVFEHPDMQKGAFLRKLNPDGTVDKGNDISFCERATEAGFGIFAHFDYQCDHMVEISLLECIRAINGLMNPSDLMPVQEAA